MTLPQYLHLYSYHLCAQDLTLTLKSVIQLGRFWSMANVLGWKGWTVWMFQDRTKFSTFSKLGKWSDEMLAPRNIPTATASRRVEESKVDLRQKSKNIVSIKKNEVSRQNKVLNILNIQTGKMILWHASGQELNLLSEKRNFKKTQNLCLKRWYLYSILRNG